jgi:lysophospholipase L1-like esterase
MRAYRWVYVGFGLSLTVGVQAEPAVELTLVGDWAVRVMVRGAQGQTAVIQVPPPTQCQVDAERYDALPVFDSRAPGWLKGVRLRGVRAQETTTPGLMLPDSLKIRAGPDPDAEVFEPGRDYQADLHWATVGRLPQGRIRANQPVWVSYRHWQLRLDSIVLTPQGQIQLRSGQPQSAAPLPPDLAPGEQRLANVWVCGGIAKLSPDHLFPILETTYPEPPKSSPTPAERLLPQAMARLRTGQPLRILAWGDSVTDGSYLPDPKRQRWQEQFLARLQARFPQARIELITEAWGGHNTAHYLAEPPGSPHNYREKVLGAQPHLVVSEFVNDAGLSPAQVEERYSRFLADFRSIGAEWIILTPHYVRPDWMGLNRERDIDDDPRPYVAGLRQFAARHSLALADAAARYGRLWRQGLPYTTLLLNSINHPDARGLELFADALMALFP